MIIINYLIILLRGQFLAMPGWWRDSTKNNYKINGGFFKYYPKECKYIYDKFMKDVEYWQQYYIKNGTTSGPVNGNNILWKIVLMKD